MTRLCGRCGAAPAEVTHVCPPVETRGKPRHTCQPPTIPQGLTVPQQPDWTCAACGRIWRDQGGLVRWWAEVRGPTHFPRGENL